MGTGCSGGPANAPIIAIFLLIVACIPLVKCECRVQTCSRQYTSALEKENVAQGSNYRYCGLLRIYHNCVRDTGRSCRGDLAYHTVRSLVEKWTGMYDCKSVIERGPQGNNNNNGRSSNNNQQKRPPRPHHECANYRVAGDSFSHCALFGDPHLRTFYDELQTCGVPGAWPLLDNPHLAVQVTNEPVGKGSTATAITKVTVIVRQHGPCAVEKTYEAQTDFLPGVFLDGSRSSGPGVRIREETPGRHVEIHLRYIATRIVIRQVGQYLTFAVKMPSSIAVQGAEGGAYELCVRGCPRRERIDFERILETDSGPKKEAIAACRALNITDFYLDACVFDLLTTGDGSFSEAARNAMLDSGQVPVVNSSLSVVPRSVESSSSSTANNKQQTFSSLHIALLVGLILFLHFHANR